MRDRLLMLADLRADHYALDVRKLFGEDYERILRLKNKLLRFKKHQGQVELLVDTYARRETLRGEMIYRWSDLRSKREAYEREHAASAEGFVAQARAAAERMQILQAEVSDWRVEATRHSEARGGLQLQLNQIAAEAKKFADFVEDLARASLTNISISARALERQLADAEGESRPKAEQKVAHYRDIVQNKRRGLEHFDRALITALRRDLTDEEMAPLACLFNFDLLDQPVGDDGARILRKAEFVSLLRAMAGRFEKGVYQDENVVLPLPKARHSLAELANPDAMRERLAEDEETLKHWESILRAISDREKLLASLGQQKAEEARLQNQLFAWEQFQKARAEEPRLRAELRQTDEAIAAALARIGKLDKQIEDARQTKAEAEQAKVKEENARNAVIGRFNECLFPEFSAAAQAPAESIAAGFDGSVSLFLNQQKRLADLDARIRDTFHAVESALGGDFAGPDEAETVWLLREELEALPEREDVLRRDWDHQLTHLRGTFHQVLKSFADIKSAADRLNRALSGIRVSNLAALKLDVVEQSDIVGSLRKLSDVEQPGLFDDSAGLEAALSGFRQRFENNSLLRYSDLFTLRFTVTGDDGKPHHYNDFRQVESHGTTITIKVLFNLLVLRSLLREDSTKALLSEAPFFLDEVHSLDAVNRHAILSTARKLGFIAITAAPESVSEVDALYFLQPQRGRIVLRNRHRIGVKAKEPAP